MKNQEKHLKNGNRSQKADNDISNFSCFFSLNNERKQHIQHVNEAVHFFITVCNFQFRKSPVELNSLLSKLFCYITWLVISPDYRRHWTTCKRGLYVKSYCSSETIAQRIKEHSSYRTPPVAAFVSLIM